MSDCLIDPSHTVIPVCAGNPPNTKTKPPKSSSNIREGGEAFNITGKGLLCLSTAGFVVKLYEIGVLHPLAQDVGLFSRSVLFAARDLFARALIISLGWTPASRLLGSRLSALGKPGGRLLLGRQVALFGVSHPRSSHPELPSLTLRCHALLVEVHSKTPRLGSKVLKENQKRFPDPRL